jgi:hypothetical protein
MARQCGPTFTLSDDNRKNLASGRDKKKAFEQYCTPVVYEVTVHYQFWQLDLPDPLVSIDVHALTLRNKAKQCNFGDQKTKVIGDKIMFCYPDKRTMEAMIRT